MSLPISLKVGTHNDNYFTKEHKDALPATPGALYVSCLNNVKGYLYYDNGTNFINIVPRLLGEENGGAGINLATFPAYSTIIQGALGTLSHVKSKAGVYFSVGENELPQFGIVPVKYGGTGLSSCVANGILYAKDENTIQTNGTFLYENTAGTTSIKGVSRLTLGNSTASGTNENSRGLITLFGESTGAVTLRYSSTATDNVTVMYPGYGGNVTISMDNVYDATDKITTFYLPFYVNQNQRLSYNTGLYCMSQAGTTSEKGVSYLCLGNGTAEGSDKNKYGVLRIFTSGITYQNLRATGTTSRTTYLRDHGATAYIVATPEDGTAYGSDILPVYVNTNGMITACTGSSVFSDLSWANGDADGPTLKLTVAGHERTATIPSASASTSGIITTGDQAFSGEKTFSTVKATTFTGAFVGDLEGVAKVAKTLRVELTNPESSSTYYPSWVSGTSNESNFIPRVNDGFRYITAEGTASANGGSVIAVGNNIAEGTAGNKRGAVRIYALDSTYCQLRSLEGSSHTYSTYLRDHGCSAYNISANSTSAYGGTSTPVYVNSDGLITTCSGNVVTSAAQAFSGFKTWINGCAYRMTQDLSKGTAPTSLSSNYISFCDKNGTAAANRLGLLYCETSTSNTSKIAMYAYKPESGVTTSAQFAIYYPSSGVAYAVTSGVEYLKTKRLVVENVSYGTAEPAAADGIIAGQIYFKII